MKFFSWMHNKLGDKQENRRPTTRASTYHAIQAPGEEFISDWPRVLLAIGTFGNNNGQKNKNPASEHIEEESSYKEEIADFTPEEVGQVQKELTKLLRKKTNLEKELSELPLDRFLNCPSSLEVDRRSSNALCSESDDTEDIEKTISVILGRCKDICADNKKKAIGKKSISFLLKKMFVCTSGFAQTPSLRDTLQESRMEKLLRMILHKKINSQSASRASSMKKYLEDRKTQEKNDDESEGKSSDIGTWVKTDSEYIVLEI